MDEPATMDQPAFLPPGACRLSVEAAGDAFAWRLTAADGSTVAGVAPDSATARRSAVFAAFTVEALARARCRRP